MFKATALAGLTASIILAVTVGPGLVEKSHEASAAFKELGSTFAQAEQYLGGDGAFEAPAAAYQSRLAAGVPIGEAGLSSAELKEARERGLELVIECAPGGDIAAINRLLAESDLTTEIRCLA